MGDISTYYGGSIMAMKGDGCVAIASDRRIGGGYQTLVMNYPKVEQVSGSAMVALTTFTPDCQMLHKYLKYEANLYKLEEGREICAPQLTKLLSAMLYEKRMTGGWFVSPIVAGLDSNKQPFVAAMDGLGATTTGDDWLVDGTGHEFLLGPAQYYYKPNMKKDELLKVVTTVMQAGTNRDALSGWGIDVWIMDKDGVEVHHQPCRMD